MTVAMIVGINIHIEDSRLNSKILIFKIILDLINNASSADIKLLNFNNNHGSQIILSGDKMIISGEKQLDILEKTEAAIKASAYKKISL